MLHCSSLKENLKDFMDAASRSGHTVCSIYWSRWHHILSSFHFMFRKNVLEFKLSQEPFHFVQNYTSSPSSIAPFNAVVILKMSWKLREPFIYFWKNSLYVKGSCMQYFHSSQCANLSPLFILCCCYKSCSITWLPLLWLLFSCCCALRRSWLIEESKSMTNKEED